MFSNVKSLNVKVIGLKILIREFQFSVKHYNLYQRGIAQNMKHLLRELGNVFKVKLSC